MSLSLVGPGAVQAIQGTPQPAAQPQNPIQTFSGWADLSNKLAENALIKQNTANAQLTNQTGQQSLAEKQANYHNQVMAGVIQLPDDQIAAGAQAALDREKASGVLDPQRYEVAQQALNATGGDPNKIRQLGFQGIVTNLTAHDQAERFLPTAGPAVDNGQYMVGTVRNPVNTPGPNPGALVQVGQGVPVGAPTNASVIQRSNAVGPDGTTGTVPLGMQPGSAQFLSPGAPNSSTQPQTGAAIIQQRPTSANPPRLASVMPNSGSNAPANGPPGFAASQPSPGQTIAPTASSQQYAEDRAQSASYGQRIFPLMQQEALLKAGTTTGPGTENANYIKSFLLSMTPAQLKNANIDPTILAKTADYEELKKYQAQALISNPLASGSNARLAEGLAGSPNSSLQSLTNRNVNRANIALTRMQQAAFQSYNGPPAGYADYLSKYATQVDPRAFAFDMLSTPERQKMIATLKTPAERTLFSQSLDVANSTPGLMRSTAMPANASQ
jgi:hypothetical protein